MSFDILVVEDEELISLDIQRSLLDMGYTVAGAASSGEKAVALTKEKTPDLILMDIVLAGTMSGIEAAREIGCFSRTPIIFLTAYADKKTLELAKKAMPYGYILKPFDSIQLQVTIETALNRYIRECELAQERISINEGDIRLTAFLDTYLPICSYCKKIRSEAVNWEKIETYFDRQFGIQFTHSICPDCVSEHFPGLQADGE